jgi:hypothetical protein
MVPSVEKLQEAFRPYLFEIEVCRKARTYWAPDICSALESDDGEAEGRKYVRWCRRHLPMEGLRGAH